jgi:hypothetical protein
MTIGEQIVLPASEWSYPYQPGYECMPALVWGYAARERPHRPCGHRKNVDCHTEDSDP